MKGKPNMNKHQIGRLVGQIAALFFICFIIYGVFWIAKHGSYYWWYEDLVKQTIKQTVKIEAIR